MTPILKNTLKLFEMLSDALGCFENIEILCYSYDSFIK